MTGNDTKKIGLLSSIYCTVFFKQRTLWVGFFNVSVASKGGFFCSFLLQPSLWNKEYHISSFESGDRHFFSSWAHVRLLYVLLTIFSKKNPVVLLLICGSKFFPGLGSSCWNHPALSTTCTTCTCWTEGASSLMETVGGRNPCATWDV